MAQKDTIKSSKRYFNCLHKITKLKYGEIYLLLYLSEIAGKECIVYTHKGAREIFIEYMDKIMAKDERYKKYGDNTVKQYLQTLKREEFLIPTTNRATMYLNPKYFYSGRNDLRGPRINMVNRRLEEISYENQTV